jgi:hypothetical protein
LVAFSLVGALGLSACGSSDDTPSVTATTVAGTTSATSLKGICPDNIVIQTDWFGTSERAAAYALVGPNGKVDATKGSYRGPLADTGVDVEVRLGGPYIGFNPVPLQMYTDDSIFMGLVATDEAVGAYDKFPTVAVVTPLDINPQGIMWDPATYTINSWADIAPTDAKIVYLEGLPYMDYLVAKGLVKKDQLDASFDGTPSRFVAAGGKLMQQVYVSNEPYRWAHDVEGWKKPVKTLLANDAGYEIYPQGYAVKRDVITSRAECLKKLTPMIQQAEVDYATTPGPINEALVGIATAINQGPPITAAGNADGIKTMLDLKLVSNGADTTLGNFDLDRVARTIEVLRPIFATRNQAVPASLKASDIVTNEFIDPSIHL